VQGEIRKANAHLELNLATSTKENVKKKKKILQLTIRGGLRKIVILYWMWRDT